MKKITFISLLILIVNSSILAQEKKEVFNGANLVIINDTSSKLYNRVFLAMIENGFDSPTGNENVGYISSNEKYIGKDLFVKIIARIEGQKVILSGVYRFNTKSDKSRQYTSKVAPKEIFYDKSHKTTWDQLIKIAKSINDRNIGFEKRTSL